MVCDVDRNALKQTLIKVRMLFNEWLGQRALLNHDVLCNQLRNELGALRADPKRTVVRLKTWPLHETEYRAFFDSSIEALSPKQFFTNQRFACWKPEMKTTFEPVFYELFMLTSNLAVRIEALHQLLTRSLNGVQTFLATDAAKRNPSHVAKLQELLESLSQEISALPSQVGGAEWKQRRSK
jgi:hypothetical protein